MDAMLLASTLHSTSPGRLRDGSFCVGIRVDLLLQSSQISMHEQFSVSLSSLLLPVVVPVSQYCPSIKNCRLSGGLPLPEGADEPLIWLVTQFHLKRRLGKRERCPHRDFVKIAAYLSSMICFLIASSDSGVRT